LLSRFLSGMHVQINAPEPELRRQILETRAAEVNLEIPESVKQELTTRITGSMRELEAAVNRLYFLDQRGVRITDFTSTPEMMLEHFRDLFPAADNRHLPMDLIIEVICQKFKVTREQILSNSRKAEFTLPRHVGMYLGIQHSNLNKSAIARYFRKGDHTTVLNAERNMMRRIEKEPGFSQLLDDIVNDVRKLCV
ncbi:MAG: hypothetical protein KDK30_08355, partial [Leptospiraceae bacterium]|nr:hypothetical protein [Leptospiraceae bacterium]